MMQPNRSMPPGIIIPELAYADVGAASAWLSDTFGFRERLRIGSHRAQLVYLGATIVVTERPAQGASSSTESGISHRIMVRVEDVDAHHERVRASGATILSPPTDYSIGERQYEVEDPGGHRWVFSQSIADVDPSAWGGELLDRG